MSTRHNINLGVWLHRLGFKRGDPPEIIDAIQPVQIVQDARRTVSPLEFSRGSCGARTGVPAAGQVAFLRLWGPRPFYVEVPSLVLLNPGGELSIGVFDAGGPGQAPLTHLGAPSKAIANEVLRSIRNEGPQPVEAKFSTGTLVGLPTHDTNAVRTLYPFVSLSWLPGSFYVQPGREFWACARVVAVELLAGLLVTEHPNQANP